ncbi:MAG: GrpB family protein [Leptolyngbya sp. SIO4C1]|nr:GrpB family protein [Leptolyngbya sp. SIO4C1]
MIQIDPYQPTWYADFLRLGQALRQALGDLALRIDHIGSTSVPGLVAKDRIDIQITVESLMPAVESALNQAGYVRVEQITQDHLPLGANEDIREWTKWVFKPAGESRPATVHVRVTGRANQRYAILFRDYLRAFPATAAAYGQTKAALAKYHADDAEAYYEVKDPVCDIIMGGAEFWAATVHWQPAPTDA